MGDILEQKHKFNNGNYEHALGGKGISDWNGNGRKEIDCSHLVNQMVRGAGYNIPYENTAGLSHSKYYEVIESKDVRPGDIVLWRGSRNHTGIVEFYDFREKKGAFFGSQSSTGPAIANFGPTPPHPHTYTWREPTKFLRPKSEYKVSDSDLGHDLNHSDANRSNLSSQGNYGAPGGPSIAFRDAAIAATSIPRRDPLAIDLDGDGIETLGRNDKTVLFDHDGDGIKTGTGWLKSDDAWLVLDRNGNGTIDNGRELFGIDALHLALLSSLRNNKKLQQFPLIRHPVA